MNISSLKIMFVKLFSLSIAFAVILLAFVCVGMFGACNQNRMKTDEKALTQKILTEEEKLSEEAKQREEQEKQLADSLAKLPKGFRFEEDRSIDPKYPPVVIDIVGSRKQSPQELKLSRFFSKIEYVRLEAVPDSNFLLVPLECFVNDKFIYCLTYGGIAEFDRQGNFVQYVCKNEINIHSHKGHSMIERKTLKGTVHASLIGNDLYYRLEDRIEGKAELMKYNNNSAKIAIPNKNSENNNPGIKHLGDMVAPLKSVESFAHRMFSKPLSSNLVANLTDGKALGNNPFIVITGLQGDTICAFKDFDPVLNYKKTVYRGVDGGNAYYSNGNLLVRQSYNDTIFQLVLPNRLIPRYILNFGNLGIRSALEGVDPGVSLKEKLIPKSFLETNRYLFITYTKDYECPNTAKTGTLKYSRLIFDKKNKTLISVFRDEKPGLHEGEMPAPIVPDLNIENDLDKIPFRWPQFTTTDGLPFVVLSGKEIKELNNPDFPIKNIRNNDKILVIYH